MQTYSAGDYIKKQREEKQISQDALCLGICNKSTLSRIERGKQEASYSVLKLLLERLGLPGERCQILMSQQDFVINDLQKEITVLNMGHNYMESLKKIAELKEFINGRNLSDDPILKQFLLRTQAVAGYEQDHQRVSYTFEEKRVILMQAIELTCPGITIETMGNYLLGEDEAKIFNQLAITYSETGNSLTAIEIYRQLLDYVDHHFAGSEVRTVMLPLTAYNYSRLLGRAGRYEEGIQVAERGRQCCVKYNKCRFLGGLLLNLSYCLHYLGEDDRSKELIIDAYYVNKAMERTSSCEIIQKYAKDELGIEIG